MLKSNLVPIIAIVAIVLMEAIAIANGIDGMVLTASVASVAGIGGYKFARKQAS